MAVEKLVSDNADNCFPPVCVHIIHSLKVSIQPVEFMPTEARTVRQSYRGLHAAQVRRSHDHAEICEIPQLARRMPAYSRTEGSRMRRLCGQKGSHRVLLDDFIFS